MPTVTYVILNFPVTSKNMFVSRYRKKGGSQCSLLVHYELFIRLNFTTYHHVCFFFVYKFNWCKKRKGQRVYHYNLVGISNNLRISTWKINQWKLKPLDDFFLFEISTTLWTSYESFETTKITFSLRKMLCRCVSHFWNHTWTIKVDSFSLMKFKTPLPFKIGN